MKKDEIDKCAKLEPVSALRYTSDRLSPERKMKRALINLNNETTEDLYSVVYDDDIEDWLDSFRTREEAEKYINQLQETLHDKDKDFFDTRGKINMNESDSSSNVHSID